MFIDMPIEVLNERCKNCPKLDVNTFTKENLVVTAVNDNGDIRTMPQCESTLRCAYLDECKILFERIFKEPKKKTPAKKATTKKTTTAKKTTTPKAHVSRGTKSGD